MNTDYFQRKNMSNGKMATWPSKIHPQELIFAAGQFQKSPLPPFAKGGWGDFRESWPKEHFLYKI
jgi:hypothetical protein